MKDEIKEILEYFRKYATIRENTMITEIEDCITNLQQENERLRKQCKEWKENHKAVCIQRDNILDNIVKNTEEKIDYKSRCEKAIEYCNYNDESLYTFEPDYDYEENMVDNYESSNFREDLLNILNGGENNENNSI